MMSDWKTRDGNTGSAMAFLMMLVLGAIMGALAFCSKLRAAEVYPFDGDRADELMVEAARLYIHWPAGRELPKAAVVWRPPEWFMIARPNKERAIWGTIDNGAIVINEAVLKTPLFQDPVVMDSALIHEQVHILQRSLRGILTHPYRDCEELNKREAEAYGVQAAYLRKHGRMLALDFQPTPCL